MNETLFPHIPLVRTHLTTTNIMFCVILALLPSAGYGMYLYGLHAALLMGICVSTCVIVEMMMSLSLGRGWTILDYSAAVTGLIGGMLLPARAPYYMAVILGVVAAVSKAAFGGIGCNWINPAGLGKLLLVIIFHSAMVDYTGGEYGAVGALTLIRQGEELSLGNMLLGHVAGPIGTGSAVTILIGAVFLFLVGITDIYIPLAYLLTFCIVQVVIGGYGLSPYHLAVQLAGGSLLFTVFFMAQDSTTSPMSREGRLVYGAILGLLTAIVRRIGAVENGALMVLVLCNLSVRWLDTRTFPAIFGVDATVRRIRRDRRRRHENPDREQTVAESVSGYQDFEEHVVPKGAMDGSETAGTIDADSIESFNNRRAVAYDTASLDPAAVKRELARQGHAMRQSMPIFGQAPAQEPQAAEPVQEAGRRRSHAEADPGTEQRTADRAEASRPSRRHSGVQENATMQNAVPQTTQSMPTITPDMLSATQSMPTITPDMLQGQPPVMNYGVPTYPNGQPMVDLNGNPMPLLDKYGNPVLDEYGNMIWGQPMPYHQPYAQPYGYGAPQGMPAMPVYGQTTDAGHNSGHGQTANEDRAEQQDRSARQTRRAEEPVSRDTDILEVAKILEAARAAEQQGSSSALKDVQYMDLSSGHSAKEGQRASSRPDGKNAGRRNKHS